MKILYLAILFLCVSSNFLLADVTRDISVAEYRITLSKGWSKASPKLIKAGVDAVWVDPQLNLHRAVMLAKQLVKSVDEEADQMAASPQNDPQLIKLLENRRFKTKKGNMARVVSLQILAGNEQMGIEAPMIFHSVYFPNKEGKAVTFKLQCSVKDFKRLKKEFEQMVISQIIEK